MMLMLVLLPAVAGAALFLTSKHPRISVALALAASLAHAAIAYFVCAAGTLPVCGFAPFGFTLRFSADGTASMYLMLISCMFPLLALYTSGLCRDRKWGGAYQLALWISLSMLDGALLADDLALMLFFWEGLLVTLFFMLLMGNAKKPGAAVKALTVSGIADLILMLGIAITVHCAGTARISAINKLPIEGEGAFGFACLMAGALGKAGCMPFHSWIPNAADDAPAPFLASFPGSLEKIAGISFAARVITQLYDFQPGSTASVIIMAVGAVTLFLGVSMALVQKDMKRLLSYHAISQVGYIVLGLGTGLPVGIAGGIYHLFNNVLYKSGLFIAAGAVERETGTTDLHRLGGLFSKMPATAVCTVIFALSIAGFPGTNGFTSKELIFDAALESGTVFYIVALIGAFMTAASFLKLTRAAFFGKRPDALATSHEAPASVVLPCALLAAACLACAVLPSLPLDRLIGSAYGFGESFASRPKSLMLVALSVTVLLLALADHLYGCKKTGSALAAADHLHDLPGVKQAYALASKGAFDPYNLMMRAIGGFACACVFIEKGVSAFYDSLLPGLVKKTGDALSRFDNGRLSRYLVLALCGLAAVGLIFYLA